MKKGRRQFLGLLFGSALASQVGASVAREATPRQTAGPFYPRTLPLDQDNDLTRVAGRDAPAAGIPANLYGHILDRDGAPLAGARVEIWQCDAHGKYHHPDDDNPVAPDENFQGFGATVADAQGRYRFRTIRPVAYPGRTPHIHFRITTPAEERLTTQLYVRGDPGNERDGLFRRLGDRQQYLLADFVRSEDDSAQLQALFDIVMA